MHPKCRLIDISQNIHIDQNKQQKQTNEQKPFIV